MQVNYELLGLPVLIPTQKMREVIETRLPIGKFVGHEGKRWVAIDNTHGAALTEDFETFNQALAYLNEKNDC